MKKRELIKEIEEEMDLHGKGFWSFNYLCPICFGLRFWRNKLKRK